MRQSRQLGKRRANATMVSRLSAEPGGHWEKSSQRAIFPNVYRFALCPNRKHFIVAQALNVNKKHNRTRTTSPGIMQTCCYLLYFFSKAPIIPDVEVYLFPYKAILVHHIFDKGLFVSFSLYFLLSPPLPLRDKPFLFVQMLLC